MKPLTKAEEQLMQVLWKTGPGFLKEVVEAYEPPRPHPNTAATLLKILAKKGFVETEPKGRNHIYKTRITKDEYGRTLIKAIIADYFDGSTETLIRYLASTVQPED